VTFFGALAAASASVRPVLWHHSLMSPLGVIFLQVAALAGTAGVPSWLVGDWSGVEPSTPLDLSCRTWDDPREQATRRFRLQRHLGTEHPAPPSSIRCVATHRTARSAPPVAAELLLTAGRGGRAKRLALSRRPDGRFVLAEARCRQPTDATICFERTHYAQPGPDEVEIVREGDGLRIRIGFGPQHGAKVYEVETYTRAGAGASVGDTPSGR
jgi:hypothetical protein